MNGKNKMWFDILDRGIHLELKYKESRLFKVFKSDPLIQLQYVFSPGQGYGGSWGYPEDTEHDADIRPRMESVHKNPRYRHSHAY